MANFADVTKWNAYKPHLAQMLSLSNKESRFATCNLLAAIHSRLISTCHMVQRKMVCFTTITRNADKQVLWP